MKDTEDDDFDVIEEYEFEVFQLADQVAQETVETLTGDAKAAHARFMRGVEDRQRAMSVALAGLQAGAASDIWYDLPAVFARHLKDEEIAALIFCLLKAVPHETAAQAVEAALEGVGDGMPDMVGYTRSEAERWARQAPQHELRSYVHAAVLRLAPATRRSLSDWLGKKGKLPC